MATVTKGYTFGSTELVTNTKLHTLVDDGTVTAIVNADIDAAAAIADTKLDTISTVNKVNGSALVDRTVQIVSLPYIMFYDNNIVSHNNDIVYKS